MKDVSLKRPKNKGNETAIASVPQDSYPGFNIYDNAPESLVDLPMGSVVIAKIKKISEEKRTGNNARSSVGFDVISVSVPEKHKSVAENVLGS